MLAARPRFPRILAAAFVAPLLVLLPWEGLVRGFGVDPRLFPNVESVARAGVQTLQDGSLPRQAGASLRRVVVGKQLRRAVERR